MRLDGITGRTVDLTITVRPAPGEPMYHNFAVRFMQNEKFFTELTYRTRESILRIDRKFSGSRRAYIHNWQGNQCDLYGMFGLNDNLEHRIIIDGKVTYTVQDPRFKEATNFLANWVSNNLIDKVSFELSQDNFLANGKGLVNL